jgi:kynureninase
VHERHANDKHIPRFAGWWGHDLSSRFGMKDEFRYAKPYFILSNMPHTSSCSPIPGAFGFRLSNPCSFPILSLLSSLEIIEEAGMSRMREKSEKLTSYLEFLIGAV